ncbi:MAG TPA: electron transport complex subunit RsxB [Burkholderiales bacterium]|nr:electron transport complex subunit RsxB [Burkholderiales bacterium]
MMDLAAAIDALLPQTQCTKCGYQGCRPYAEAIARDEADINQCPPGGAAGIGKLAQLLGRTQKALNPVNGVEKPRTAALIDESRCIGCMLCIHACPVDAIVGSPKQMHTVLTGFCTGCDLCVPPCPVDCIEMLELGSLAARGNRHAAALARESVEQMAALARDRYQSRQRRLQRERIEREQQLEKKAQARLARPESPAMGRQDPDHKKAVVRAAIDRARARLARRG